MTGSVDLDLVIFDCDGVLVDSEPLSDASWAGALVKLSPSVVAAIFTSQSRLAAATAFFDQAPVLV